MSGYGLVGSPSIVLLEREIFNNSGFFLRGFFFFFLFSDFIDLIKNSPRNKKSEREKQKKVWGWGLGVVVVEVIKDVLKGVERKKKKNLLIPFGRSIIIDCIIGFELSFRSAGERRMCSTRCGECSNRPFLGLTDGRR